MVNRVGLQMLFATLILVKMYSAERITYEGRGALPVGKLTVAFMYECRSDVCICVYVWRFVRRIHL
jgi:hypothetical protein